MNYKWIYFYSLGIRCYSFPTLFILFIKTLVTRGGGTKLLFRDVVLWLRFFVVSTTPLSCQKTRISFVKLNFCYIQCTRLCIVRPIYTELLSTLCPLVSDCLGSYTWIHRSLGAIFSVLTQVNLCILLFLLFFLKFALVNIFCVGNLGFIPTKFI